MVWYCTCQMLAGIMMFRDIWLHNGGQYLNACTSIKLYFSHMTSIVITQYFSTLYME